jgi:chemotaxis signal transduction protein
LGTIIFRGQPICVVNASELVGGKKKELSTSSQVIVLKMEKGLIGLLVEELGEIPEVPSSFIVNASDCGHMDNEAIEYIIKPPPSAPANKIMLALNPSHFLTSVVSEKTMKQLAQISQNQTKNQSQSKSQIELKATVNE